MKNIVCYLLLIIPLLFSCQKQFNSPPYNDYEKKIRELPLETQKIIIPKEWQKMDSLSFLRLKNTTNIIIDADSIPSWITKFENVKTIYSHFGKIKSLPINMGNMENLEKIAIFSHSLEKLPSSLCSLKKLDYLSLSSNSLQELPDCVFQLKNLKTLDLISNRIKKIPPTINFEKVEKLNLQGNQIQELPESIYNLPKLKEISLGGNPLKNPKEIKKKFSEKGIKVNLE